MFILPYVSNLGKIIKKWKNALKPRGLLFASIIAGKGEYCGPDPLNPKMKLFFKRIGKNEIKKLIRDNGLTILKTKTIIHKTEHEKHTGFSLLHKKRITNCVWLRARPIRLILHLLFLLQQVYRDKL